MLLVQEIRKILDKTKTCAIKKIYIHRKINKYALDVQNI